MRLSRQSLVIGALVVAACSDSPSEPGIGAPAAVIAEGAGGVIAVGDTVQLTARVVDANGRRVTTAAVTWRSLDPEVARVDASGQVSGEDPGSARIVAEAGTAADTVRLDVEIQARHIDIAVDPFDDCCRGDTTSVGGRVALRATVLDGRGRRLASVPVTWSVTDSMQATTPIASAFFGYAISQTISAGHVTVVARAGGVRAERAMIVALRAIDMDVVSLTQLGLGYTHACGLDVAGHAVCWGGDGRPAAVVSDQLVFATLRVGGNLACGITPQSRLWCWSHLTKSPVAMLDGAEVEDVTLNAYGAACARATSGESWCWSDQSPPARVTPPAQPRSLVTASTFTCALATTGRAWCEGSSFGQAGYREVAGDYPPLTRLVAGSGFACGLTADGQAYCFGDNASGRLGAGPPAAWSATARRVETAERFTDIGAGAEHACAITAAGAIWCWGRVPTYATADIVPRWTPYQLSIDERFRGLVVGNRSMCGIREDRDLRCQGFGSSPRGS